MTTVEFYLSLDREVDIWDVKILDVKHSVPLSYLSNILADIKPIISNLKGGEFYEVELKPYYVKDGYDDDVFDGYQVFRVREVGSQEWIEV